MNLINDVKKELLYSTENEWKDFADRLLEMIPEISENI